MSTAAAEIRAALKIIDRCAADLAAQAQAVEPKLPEVFYFGTGRHERTGLRWCDPEGGRCFDERMPPRIDAVYAPRTNNSGYGNQEMPQGVARTLLVSPWTIVAWWDRSGDPRGNCNSALVAKGIYSFDAMLAAGRTRYPWVFERIARAGFSVVAETP